MLGLVHGFRGRFGNRSGTRKGPRTVCAIRGPWLCSMRGVSVPRVEVR